MASQKKLRQDTTISDFYCVVCGSKGIPLPRTGRQREPGHLKKLWCPHCQKETNHVEIRPFGSYRYEDFKEEWDLGRFINDERVEVTDLLGCNKVDCKYNRSGKCWNANCSYPCPHRPVKE